MGSLILQTPIIAENVLPRDCHCYYKLKLSPSLSLKNLVLKFLQGIQGQIFCFRVDGLVSYEKYRMILENYLKYLSYLFSL